MVGPCKGDETARLARPVRAKRPARRAVRSVIRFGLELERPGPAGQLVLVARERDRSLIAAVTRVAAASLGTLSRRCADPGGPAASIARIQPGGGPESGAAGARPRSS